MSAREHIIPVFVPHIGCPYRCVFCNQHHISGTQKPATAETVHEALRQAAELNIPAPRQLAFYGGSFTAIPPEQQEALLAAAYSGIESGFISSIRLSTRPDAVDAEILDRLKRYGVTMVELGAQSLDDEVLSQSKRGHHASDVVNAAELVKANGFSLVLQMMTGLPGDTLERTVNTAKEIIRLAPDAVRIYPTVVVRDTELYYAWQNGRYHEHTVDEAVEYCAAILPLFTAAGVPVIRLGLNPTEELSGGAAAGGAYHPALGELVKSRILRNRAEDLLKRETLPNPSVATLAVNPSCVSQMIGQHRQNISYLQNTFRLHELKVKGDTSVPVGELRAL